MQDAGQHFGASDSSGSNEMYELEYPAPVVDTHAAEDSGPTLIVALHGYADAGQAVEASADHLKAALENRLVASFNTDELIDYRSRRPITTISPDHPIEIENLELDMRVLRDSAGKSFLLLSGPEPDLRWHGFTKAVTDLIEKFGVTDTIVVYSAPAPSPHTRPLIVSAHGNAPALVNQLFRFDSTTMLPGAAPLFIEKALADKGHNVAGYTVHVPHYLAASSYPQATFSLLDSVQHVAGLSLPLRSLKADIERFSTELEEQISDSEEVHTVVRQLEEQYDSYLERYRKEHPQSILPGEETSVPTGEELSQEFEAFLTAIDGQSSWRDQILHEDINDWEDNYGDDSPDDTPRDGTDGEAGEEPGYAGR